MKSRGKIWIYQIGNGNPTEHLLVSAMADATMVPPVCQFSHINNVGVCGILSNHDIKKDNYDQE